MSSAGQRLIAGRIPGELITRELITSDSAGVTSETVVGSVTAPVVVDRSYTVTFFGHFQSTQDGDQITWRIREDNVSGTMLNAGRVHIAVGGDTSGTFGYSHTFIAPFAASITGNKTFVFTISRQSGTGSVRLEAADDRPAIFDVRYEMG